MLTLKWMSFAGGKRMRWREGKNRKMETMKMEITMSVSIKPAVVSLITAAISKSIAKAMAKASAFALGAAGEESRVRREKREGESEARERKERDSERLRVRSGMYKERGTITKCKGKTWI